MHNPDSWMRIQQVAERRRDVSARDLAQLVIKANAAEQKLQMLLEYRLDYRNRFDAASRAGMRGEWLRNYQSFIANLEQAIAQQNAVIAGLRREVADARRQVNGEQRRAESYQIIGDRRNDAALMEERKRQQRLQDEIAMQLAPRLAFGRD